MMKVKYKLMCVTILVVAIVLSGIAMSFGGRVSATASNGLINYSLVDELTELNKGNWTAKDPNQTINFNSNITFLNDRANKDTGYEGAKLISNVKFLSGNTNVFDLTFSPYVTNNYKGSADPAEVAKSLEFIRFNRQMSMGVMFGMASQSSTLANSYYMRINPPFVDLYYNGEKIQPKTSANSEFSSYMDHDDPNTMRMVAKSDGTLTLYIGNRFFNINEPFAVYEGLSFEGYLAFATNSYKTETIDLPLSFKTVKLTGTTTKDMENFDILDVSLNKSNLLNAVVSNKPILLSAKVVAKPNLIDFHEVKYSVIGSSAEVDGDKLVIKSAEPFTLKVTSKYNQRMIEEYSVKPKVLNITKLEMQDKEFGGLTIFSQPIRLSTVVESNYSYIRELNQVEYKVVSGNAKITTYYSVTSDTYISQLNVTGSGEVVIRATSTVLGDKFDELKFTVVDPDAERSGCGASMTSTVPFVAVGLVLIVIMCRRRKNKSL